MSDLNKLNVLYLRKSFIEEMINRYGDKFSKDLKNDFESELNIENIRIKTLKNKLINELK
jgi:ribosomal protein S17E